MSGTWSGFTEEDIKKLKATKTKDLVKKYSNLSQKTKQGHKPREFENNEMKTQNGNEIPEDAKLSVCKKEVNANIITEVPNSEKQEAKINTVNKIITSNTVIEEVNNETKIDSLIIETTSKLDEFEAKQKFIKEQNRKRKELLAKALADRTKKTTEEAKKLKEIKEEFKKLDALLSNDVSVLRHEIEVASIEFMEAQKKYQRVEKEFLDAKIVLHHKMERKELLTDHLCTIIEKNEERKAEKLSELMSRLDLDKFDDTSEDLSKNVDK